jgi:hypothetical protein
MRHTSRICMYLVCCAPLGYAHSADQYEKGKALGDAYLQGQEIARQRAAEAQAAQQLRLQAERERAAAAEQQRAKNSPPAQPRAQSNAWTPRTVGEMPNMGEKPCGIWLAYYGTESKEEGDDAGGALSKAAVKAQLGHWQMGYLRGMADLWARITQQPNPLVYVRDDREFVEWTTSYCRVHIRELMGDAAIAFLNRLAEIGEHARNTTGPPRNARQ